MPEVKIKDFPITNEPVLTYLKGSKERKELEAALEKTAATTHDVPIVIGEKEYKTDDVRYQVSSKWYEFCERMSTYVWAVVGDAA